MTHRERVLAALNHCTPDRVPMDLGSTANTSITVDVYERLKTHLGISSKTVIGVPEMSIAEVDEPILKHFDIDFRGLWTGYGDKWPGIPEGAVYVIDEWGVERCRAPGSPYYDSVRPPMADGLSLKALDTYPWPDPYDPGRLRGITERWKWIKEETDYASVLYIRGGFITMSQNVRGLAGWLEDILLEPELMGELLDRTLYYQSTVAYEALKACNFDVDVVHFGDDLGTQKALMISPNTYREILKPRQAKLFDVVKSNGGAKILYHSCGSNYDLFEDLIEIGMDAYNPVQHRAAKMDREALKREFGNRVTFWGGIDTSEILNHGSVQDVEDEVRRVIDIMGENGGYVLNAVHNIQPDVPVENICALYEAGLKYGLYSL